MNNKGEVNVLLYITIFAFIIMFIGILAALGVSIGGILLDEITPAVQSIGSAGGSNITEYSNYVLEPLNTVYEDFYWLTGIFYIFALMALLIFSYGYRLTVNPIYVTFFFLLAILLVFASIYISNMYEDLLEGNNDISVRLEQQTIITFLLVYSPIIMSIIIFLAGIIMFTGGDT